MGKVLAMAVIPSLLPAIGFGVVAMVTHAAVATILPMAGMMGSMAMAIGITTTLTRRDEDARLEAEQREFDLQTQTYEESLTEAEAEAERFVQRETVVAEASFRAPSDLLRSAAARDASIWERRPEDDDFLELRLGTGRRRSCVNFASGGAAAADASQRDVMDRLSWQDAAPISARFSSGTRTGLIGQPEPVSNLLGWLLFQAATLHAPWELSIVVLSRDEDLCSWAKWLPHCGLKSKNVFQPLVARWAARRGRRCGRSRTTSPLAAPASQGRPTL